MPAHPKPGKKAAKPGSFAAKKPKSLAIVEALVNVPASPVKPVKPKPDGQTKNELIKAMLVKGATSKEIEAATGWAPHSVRGFLGTLRKQGVNVISTKLKGEPTIYRIVAASNEVL